MVIHTNENGLLDLDRSDTHFHAKRYKIVMIVPLTCGTALVTLVSSA